MVGGDEKREEEGWRDIWGKEEVTGSDFMERSFSQTGMVLI